MIVKKFASTKQRVRFGISRSKASAFEQVVFRGVAYLAGNGRINLDSILSLGIDQSCAFYDQANLVVFLEVFNRRERLENTGFIYGFNRLCS